MMKNIFKIFNALDKNMIVHKKIKIHTIIDYNDEVWFNAKQIANLLKYKDTKNAIKSNVEINDTIYLKYINYDSDDNTIHPNSIYLNEAGLYSLLFSSKMPEAKKFKYWITHQILPSIRKYGYYKLKNNTDNKIKNLTDQINYLIDKNNKIKQDINKPKYPDGGIVYAIDYSTEQEEIYRIGMTGNMKLRKKLYDTHTLHDHDVVMIRESKCPSRLEACLKSMLYDYRYGNKKDFYVCSLRKIKLSIGKCVKSMDCIDKQKGGSKRSTKNENIISNKLLTLQYKKNKLLHKSKLLQKIIIT